MVREKYTTTNFKWALSTTRHFYFISLFSLFSKFQKGYLILLSSHIQYPHLLHTSTPSMTLPHVIEKIEAFSPEPSPASLFEQILHWNGFYWCLQWFYFPKSNGKFSLHLTQLVSSTCPSWSCPLSPKSLAEPEIRTCMQLVYLRSWLRKKETGLKRMNQERRDHQFKDMLLIYLPLRTPFGIV